MQVYNFTREYTNKIIENISLGFKNDKIHNNDTLVPKIDSSSEK